MRDNDSKRQFRAMKEGDLLHFWVFNQDHCLRRRVLEFNDALLPVVDINGDKVAVNEWQFKQFERRFN